MAAFNHRILGRTRAIHSRAAYYRRCVAENRGWRYNCGSCQRPHCCLEPAAEVRYCLTGRTGRVSECILYLCKPHAKAFAAKHGAAPRRRP